jgi:mono/diheme cytochrome c family protein
LSRPTAVKGKELYDSNGCASCHGREGHGDGAIARTIEVPPTDFRHPETFLRGRTPDAIAKTLSEGIAVHLTASATLKQTHHLLVMPQFNHLSEEERHSLALYVLSIYREQKP